MLCCIFQNSFQSNLSVAIGWHNNRTMIFKHYKFSILYHSYKDGGKPRSRTELHGFRVHAITYRSTSRIKTFPDIQFTTGKAKRFSLRVITFYILYQGHHFLNLDNSVLGIFSISICAYPCRPSGCTWRTTHNSFETIL